MTARFYIFDGHCFYKNLQTNIFVSQCKRYILKEFQKSRAPGKRPSMSAVHLRPAPSHTKVLGLLTRPAINKQQKQIYSHRQIAAVFQL